MPHPLRALKDKLRSKTEAYIKPQAPVPKHIEPVAPPANEVAPCVSFEDFTVETSSLFSLDLLEGCRLVISRAFGATGTPTADSPPPLGEAVLSHSLNLGTYPTMGSQASLLRALLQSQGGGGGERGAKGGHNWSTSLKLTSPSGRKSFLTRYSSRSETTEGRAVVRLTDGLLARASFVTPSALSYCNTLAKLACRPLAWRKSIQEHDISQDLGIVALEHSTPDANLSGKVSWQDTPVYTLSYVRRMFPRFYAGAEMTLMKSSGAVVSNYGVRFTDDSNIAAGILSVSPNFEKTMAEGLKEKVFALRMSLARKLTERITVVGEVESPLSALFRSTGRLGYEYQFAQARIMGCIDSNFCMQQTLEDATGLQMSGELDFKNDNYKFGFGFELTPTRMSS